MAEDSSKMTMDSPVNCNRLLDELDKVIENAASLRVQEGGSGGDLTLLMQIRNEMKDKCGDVQNVAAGSNTERAPLQHISPVRRSGGRDDF
jgi:hypothetical protein